jgi:ABC-type proline/glycine betaine transport system ATPase subunit
MASEYQPFLRLRSFGRRTLVRMLNQRIEPTAGELCVDGENVATIGGKPRIELRRHHMMNR